MSGELAHPGSSSVFPLPTQEHGMTLWSFHPRTGGGQANGGWGLGGGGGVQHGQVFFILE